MASSTDENHWLISAALVTSSIIAVTANSFLLLIFCRRRGLRTVPNRFVINLLVTNLLSSLLLIPLLIVDQETVTSPTNSTLATIGDGNSSIEIQKFIIQEDASNTTTIIETSEKITFIRENDETENHMTRKLLLCYFAQGSTSFVCTLSILSILLIGINQYFGVIHSLRYHFYINKCRSMAFIITTWLVALIFSVLSCLTHSDSALWRFCKKMPQHSDLVKIFNTIYAFSYFIFIILAPFAAICVIYVCIYTAAHQNSERMRQSTSANLDNYVQVEQVETTPERVLPKVHSAPNFRHYDDTPPISGMNTPSPSGTNTPTRQKVARTCSDRNNFISTLKHKISNASVFRYREETRAAKISILVIFLVLFCYVPYGIALVLNSELVRIKTSAIFNCLSLILLVFSNIISPFLFAYRNKRVKREIAKLFGLIPQRPSLALEKNRRPSVASSKNRSFEDIREGFLTNFKVPEVIVTCKVETQERKSILKRVGTTWTSYKKCNFITVPDSCISGEARGSFSSASTQISSEDC